MEALEPREFALRASQAVQPFAVVPVAGPLLGSSAGPAYAAPDLDLIPCARDLRLAQSRPRSARLEMSWCICPSFLSGARSSACYGFHPSPDRAEESLRSPLFRWNVRHCR